MDRARSYPRVSNPYEPRPLSSDAIATFQNNFTGDSRPNGHVRDRAPAQSCFFPPPNCQPFNNQRENVMKYLIILAAVAAFITCSVTIARADAAPNRARHRAICRSRHGQYPGGRGALSAPQERRSERLPGSRTGHGFVAGTGVCELHAYRTEQRDRQSRPPCRHRVCRSTRCADRRYHHQGRRQ